MKKRSRLFALLLVSGLAACEEAAAPPKTPPPPAPPAPTTPVASATATAAPSGPDRLGPKPELGPVKPFEPPAPEVFKTANGLSVWLLERHSLPLVAATMVVPLGSAADPKGQEGLAHITADLLDEGAGARNAVQVSSAILDLGASLGTGASPDGSAVSLSVLKKNFDPAFKIFSDVIARPRLDPKDWQRVSDLWKNDLKKRSSDANEVARVVIPAALFGPDAPYGHPADGRLDSAQRIDLAAVKAFYASAFRPDAATLVVVGDLTRPELEKAIDGSLKGWKAPKTPRIEPPVPPGPKSSGPRLVLVDRPADAPQSVIAVVREGVVATDPRAPLLDLVNQAVGGSFTSRLNTDLREEHGWTYGATSAFTENRGTGAFVAKAAVVAESTGPALGAMLRELRGMAEKGPTPEELGKVLAQDRADMVEGYQAVGSIAQRLGRVAMLGLPPDFDAKASRVRQQATLPKLIELATAVDPKAATVVVVGPKASVLGQIAPLGLPAPELWDAEGRPLAAASKP